MSFFDTSADIPEFRLPFTFTFVVGAGDVLYVEQGDDAEVQQRVYAMLSYEPGQFIADPDFGVSSQLFRKNGVDVDAIQQALERMDSTLTEVVEANPLWFLSLVETISARRDSTNA